MPKPLPVAAVAIVDAWIAANVMGAFCKDDERKQVLSEMKEVGALMHSLALDGAFCSLYSLATPCLRPTRAGARNAWLQRIFRREG